MCRELILDYSFLLSLAFVVPCEAAPTLSTSDRASLLDEGAFHLLAASTPIPAEAIRFCADGNGRAVNRTRQQMPSRSRASARRAGYVRR